MNRRSFFTSLSLGILAFPALLKAAIAKPRRLSPWYSISTDDWSYKSGDGDYHEYRIYRAKGVNIINRFGLRYETSDDGRRKVKYIHRLLPDGPREVDKMETQIEVLHRNLEHVGKLDYLSREIGTAWTLQVRWREWEDA